MAIIRNGAGTPAVSVEPLATLPPDAGATPAPLLEVVPVPGAPGALAAVDTQGVVWLVDPAGTAEPRPLVDLRDASAGFVAPGKEAGLRSIAFHPDFATEGARGEGKLYLSYSADPAVAPPPEGVEVLSAGSGEAIFHDVVAEFTVADPSDPEIDPGTRRELFRIEQPFSTHNIGRLVFGDEDAPEGSADGRAALLWITTGDGGGANDPLDAAERLGTIYGKVLRIDPLGENPGDYAVPESNPFVGTEGARPEIWAYGFRNPQHLSFHDGHAFVGDIGQDAREEIDVVLRGGHHGWDDREGTAVNDAGTILPLPAEDPEPYVYPLAEYAHEDIEAFRDGNAAVTGGFVYRGEAVPELRGAYVFANFPTGDMFYVPLDGLDAILADGRVTPDETMDPVLLGLVDAAGEPVDWAGVVGSDGRVDLRFGETAEGELLAFSKQDGTIYRIVAPGSADPAALSAEEVLVIASLYELALDRNGAIDAAGLNFWVDAVEDGLAWDALAGHFLASPEFRESRGDPAALSDGAFLDLLYADALGREADADGRAFWLSALGGPELGRADVLLDFARSAERSDLLAGLGELVKTGPGEWDFA